MGCALAIGACLTVQPCHAAKLTLATNVLEVQKCQTFSVTLSMSELNGALVSGFQAFVQFDASRVEFISGSYTSVPLGLPIITPITATGGNIDLAAGINQLDGQQPTSADALLATLNFRATEGGCSSSVAFRPNNPPTTLSDSVGQPVLPLVLVNPGALPSCNASCTRADLFPVGSPDHVVGPGDLAQLLASWGRCPINQCCAADIFPVGAPDGQVGPGDLAQLLASWGPCAP